MIDLDVQLATQASDLPTHAMLENWAVAALTGLKDDAELSIRIVDIEESQSLNHEYRGKDKPTNVLSFTFESPPELAGIAQMDNLIGDLVICAPVVAQEAVEQNKPHHHHFAHMVVHGCLHLLGYDHIKDDEADTMEALEQKILAQLNIADPYLSNDE